MRPLKLHNGLFEGAVGQVTLIQPMGSHMRNFLSSFLRDESGAAAAEYALILAIVGAGIAYAATQLGTAISTAINTAQSQI